MTGKLLGHHQLKTTARYAPLARDSIYHTLPVTPKASLHTYWTRSGETLPPDRSKRTYPIGGR